MAYKCRICGSNDVEHMGDICELCAIGQDPYASAMQGNSHTNSQLFMSNESNTSYIPSKGKSRKVLIGGGASVANTDPYGNNMVSEVSDEDSVQVYQAGQVPPAQQNSTTVNTYNNGSTDNLKKKSNEPISYGITKNITIDNQKRSILEKWFRALFSGIPFTLDDDVTMFQVFPDYSGTSLNAMGNACDQIIVYGKLNVGAVAENNDIEVYGHRDANNNVIATMIKNKASGTTITPDKTLSASAVRIITIIIFAIIFGTVAMIGFEGIVWTIVLLLCLTNLPVVMKWLGILFGSIFSIFKRLF